MIFMEPSVLLKVLSTRKGVGVIDYMAVHEGGECASEEGLDWGC